MRSRRPEMIHPTLHHCWGIVLYLIFLFVFSFLKLPIPVSRVPLTVTIPHLAPFLLQILGSCPSNKPNPGSRKNLSGTLFNCHLKSKETSKFDEIKE